VKKLEIFGFYDQGGNGTYLTGGKRTSVGGHLGEEKDTEAGTPVLNNRNFKKNKRVEKATCYDRGERPCGRAPLMRRE